MKEFGSGDSIIKMIHEAVKVKERGDNYGDPWVNHRRIADLMNTVFETKLKPGQWFTPQDAAMFAVLQKIGRLIQTPDHVDSLEDIINYMGIILHLDDVKKRADAAKDVIIGNNAWRGEDGS